MIAEATRYEKFLEARGAGAFGKVEYEGATKITLPLAFPVVMQQSSYIGYIENKVALNRDLQFLRYIPPNAGR